MASSGSDASDRAPAAVAAATGSLLGSLSNPKLASLPAAELVVRLYNNRRGSDFADVAVVLAERERRLAEAEAQIRRAGEREARLQAEARACERRRSTEPGELLPADVRGPDSTAASVDDQLEGVKAQLVGAHASRASEVEVGPLDCSPSAVEEATAGVLAMLAEAAADLPRLSPLRTTAADALLAPALQHESECNKENEDSGNSGHGLAIVPLGYFADATSVASEESDNYGRIQHLTESQMWEEFNKMKAHVSAWESELNAAADGAGTPTTPAQEAAKVVCESEAEAAAIQVASETEERLHAEITACKEKAHATQVGLWAEILARGNAIQDLEARKSRAEEAAQRQARAASMIEAQLRDEIAACKREAAEAEASHRAEIKACEDRAAAAIAGLQEEMRKRDRLAGEVLAHKLAALDGYHTAIQNGLRISIQARELTIQYLSGSGPSLGDEVEAMGAQQDAQRVSGREHTGGPAAAASSSRAQASGHQ